ncbi:MAG TPA: VTT domain-containing protein [Candidatus Angelobacter sp.]|nr:VTT domain-containing protein [Candidatus Angelobacter sp.]
MSFKQKLLLKYGAIIAALKALGTWGVLLIALLDAAAFGIPMDPLMAGFVYSSPPKALFYCLAASIGSAVGSLLPYLLGRAGGELFLLKRINEARLQRIRDRFEKQEFLALMIPAMLPPPTPFKLFVFSAGVFEMKTLQFLLAVFLGRMVRFGVLSVLTIVFGPEIVSTTKMLIHRHPSIAIALGVAILALAYLLFRLLRQPVAEVVHEIEEPEGISNF